MKFILRIEDAGYEIRFWNEINETVGEPIARSWKKDGLYQILVSKGFKISKKELVEAFSLLEEKPFVVLTSQKKEIDLDTFLTDLFVIDKELTNSDQ